MMMSYNELTRVNKDRMTRTSPSSFFLFRFPSKLRPCWFFRRFITDFAPPCQAYSIFIYKLRRINDNERTMMMMMTFAASISFTTKSVRMASRCKVPLLSHIIWKYNPSDLESKRAPPLPPYMMGLPQFKIYPVGTLLDWVRSQSVQSV